MKSWYSTVMVLLACPVWADIVHLNDGTKLEGTIQREEGGWVVKDKAGKTTHVSDSRIDSIEKTGTVDAATAAESRLTALRRSIENLSDLNLIIDRYTKFLAESKGTPAGAAAQKELEEWKDRQAKGMVKVGKAWLTPDQRAELLGKSAAVIDEARALIKDGRHSDAEAAVSRLLTTDPSSAAGYYLRGVLAYKQEQLGQAKKAFERVRELVKDHGPTLNNLAVIAWRQEQYAMAMLLYDQAMLAQPSDRRILDNTAEALSALPGSERDSTGAKRAARRFQEQDAELQKQLAAEGLTRWGAIYVNKEQLAEVKRLQGKLEQLTQDYERMKTRIEDVDRLLDANEEALERINRDRAIWDSTKREYVYLRRPSIYYDLKRENDRLRDERADLTSKLPGFEEKRQTILRDSPIKPSTGIQRIIEGEGTPLTTDGKAEGARPTTKPA